MAEKEAGQQDDGHEQEEQQQDGEQHEGGEGEGGEREQRQQEGRTYTQAEVDRILNKVRKNARYLGRKEAEAELLRQGATQRQADKALDGQQGDGKREEPKGPPKREDFDTYEEYLDAKADYTSRKASREEREAAEAEARKKRVADERQKTEREFKKRAEAVMKEIPDWADTIESAEGVMITEAMGEAIQESELGPRILYHLVQNPDEADRISQLSPKAQLREIGKLEAKIEAELKGKAKSQGEEDSEDGGEQEGEERDESAEGKGEDKGQRNADGTFKSGKKRAAPEPIETVGARSGNTNRGPSDKDDINTWMRKREEEERRARSR